ncbi:hypothetical protein RBLE17_24610 [Rhodobacteraceae bacterium LE17]|nr:hypothetical protein [Rhodobacteraceae bacterium LE17]
MDHRGRIGQRAARKAWAQAALAQGQRREGRVGGRGRREESCCGRGPKPRRRAICRGKGRGPIKHVCEPSNLAHIPTADFLIEGHGVLEHSSHIRDSGGVPSAEILIEG